MKQKQVKTNYKLELNGRTNSDGTITVLLRVSSKGERFRVSTGIRFMPKTKVNAEGFEEITNFNPKYSGNWISDLPNKIDLNNKIDKFITEQKTKVNKERDRIIEKEKVTHIGINSIRNAVFKTELPNDDSFLDFFKKQIKDAISEHSANYSKNLQSKLNNLEAYLVSIGKEDLTFQEFDTEFLNNYKMYMIKKGSKPNTIISNFKDIRSVFYKKWKSPKYKGDNPFKAFEVGTMQSIKAKLDAQDIELIKRMLLEPGSEIWHCRNYFMFSFYCAGIRVGDFMNLQWRNVKGNRLTYIMRKTGKEHSIILVPSAIEILDQYRPKNKDSKRYIFPILHERMQQADKFTLEKQMSSKTAMINMNLKRLQKVTEIDTKITFHVSRHSFAGIAKDRKVSLYDIMKMLGHTKLSITETYLKELGEKVSDEAMQSTLEGL